MRSLAERDARAMEAAARAMEEATKRMEEASKAALTTNTTSNKVTNTAPSSLCKNETEDLAPPPSKRPTTEEDRLMAHAGVPSAHLKITSRGEIRNVLCFIC